jgi:DNA replication and repair protein RecF
MVLRYLELENFRNYEKGASSFLPDCNLLIGSNAQGKTNLIEAIFTLCLTKSFRSNSDSELVYFGREEFRLFGNFISDRHTSHEVAISYHLGQTKEVHLDRKKGIRASQLVGLFPVVLLSPAHYSTTLGGPSQRRRFVDMLLAQCNPKYLQNLQAYLRVVRQRNKILNRFRAGDGVRDSVLEPWDVGLVEWGSQVIQSRIDFLDRFNGLLAQKYSWLTDSDQKLELRYLPSSIDISGSDIRQAFERSLETLRKREKARGTTLLGPHRDDFRFLLNGLDLRKFGSQGEHKTVLMACKLAEFDFLREKRGETPILLLDDVFSELDVQRRRQIWQTLTDVGQTFISATEELHFPEAGKAKVYRIHQGSIFSDDPDQ